VPQVNHVTKKHVVNDPKTGKPKTVIVAEYDAIIFDRKDAHLIARFVAVAYKIFEESVSRAFTESAAEIFEDKVIRKVIEQQDADAMHGLLSKVADTPEFKAVTLEFVETLHETLRVLGKRMNLPPEWGGFVVKLPDGGDVAMPIMQSIEVELGEDVIAVTFPDSILNTPERHEFRRALLVSTDLSKLPPKVALPKGAGAWRASKGLLRFPSFAVPFAS